MTYYILSVQKWLKNTGLDDAQWISIGQHNFVFTLICLSFYDSVFEFFKFDLFVFFMVLSFAHRIAPLVINY